MKTKGVRIYEKPGKDLVFRLKDILNLVDNGESLNWTIYDIDITFIKNPNEEAKSIYNQIEESSVDYKISWAKLNFFADNIYQVIDGTFLGCKEYDQLKIYQDEYQMKKFCEISIIMTDSTYWDIFTQNENFYNNLIKQIPVDEYLCS